MVIYLIKRLKNDDDYKDIFDKLKPWVTEMYERAYEADCKWIDYLYESDPALIGISIDILKQYSLYNISSTMSRIGLEPINENIKNPVEWSTKYFSTSNIQTALNETDGINYLFGIIDKDIEEW